MIIIQMKKDNDVLNIIKKQNFEQLNIEFMESNSLGFDSIIQIFIPISSILAPVVSSIVSKVLETKKIIIKYKDVEISAGSYKEFEKALQLIDKQKNHEN